MVVSAFRAVLISLGMAAMVAVTFSAHAECVRFTLPPQAPGEGPALDGPGSFGPWQDTVTLDCLRYVGSVNRGGEEHVLIEDERGAVHELGVGHPIGRNFGHISRMDEDFIYIDQFCEVDPVIPDQACSPHSCCSETVEIEGTWMVKQVMFPKHVR